MDDRAIEQLLRSERPVVPDDAFTARVMGHVERRRRLRRWLPLAALALGLAVAHAPLVRAAVWLSASLASAPARLLALLP